MKGKHGPMQGPMPSEQRRHQRRTLTRRVISVRAFNIDWVPFDLGLSSASGKPIGFTIIR